MKTIIILFLISILGLQIRAQETIDTTDVEIKYSDDGYFKFIGYKNADHYKEQKNEVWPAGTENLNCFNISQIEINKVNTAIVQSLSKGTIQSFNKYNNGGQFSLMVKFNSEGKILSVIIRLFGNFMQVDLPKKEVIQIMQKLKKEVKLDINEKCKGSGNFYAILNPKIPKL